MKSTKTSFRSSFQIFEQRSNIDEDDSSQEINRTDNELDAEFECSDEFQHNLDCMMQQHEASKSSGKMSYYGKSTYTFGRNKTSSTKTSYKSKVKTTKSAKTPIRSSKSNQKFYTKSGCPIFSPKRYAATGAPMYTTPKYSVNKKNVNKPTLIYEVSCKNNVTYVGKTTNVKRRMSQHFTGKGSKVTKKFPPLRYRVVKEVPGFLSSQEEHNHTKKLVNAKGYEKVRGGKWTNSTTLRETSSALSQRAELRRRRLKHFLGK